MTQQLDSPTAPFGIINLHKPSGPTSHDMVALVRKRLKVKQVGHAGTLDPLATGVLVIGVGPATRLMTFLGEQRKEYIARLLLGRETDSQDITGVTLRDSPTTEVTLESLEHTVEQFRGPILQTPPMVSAVRKDGRRLYEIAREGKTVERAARPVTVYGLEVLQFTPGEHAEAVLRVQCSGGFYVRTLCADIGERLGCGGCMAALERTAVGPFRVQDALSLEEFAEKGVNAVLPPSTAVAHLPRLVMTSEQESRVRHGNHFEGVAADERLPGVSGPPTAEGEVINGNNEDSSSRVVRLEDAAGQLVAMARTLDMQEGRRRYQPFLVLVGG